MGYIIYYTHIKYKEYIFNNIYNSKKNNNTIQYR